MPTRGTVFVAPFRRLLPLLALAPLILSGCAGSLARASVEPDAFGSATLLPEEDLLELRSVMTGKLRADTVKAAGAGGTVIHAFVLEPGPYGLEWTSRQTGDGGFRFSFGWESDSVTLRSRTEPRGTVVALHGLGAEGAQLLTPALFFAEHGYRVVLPDLRAHGPSRAGASSPTATASGPTHLAPRCSSKIGSMNLSHRLRGAAPDG